MAVLFWTTLFVLVGFSQYLKMSLLFLFTFRLVSKVANQPSSKSFPDSVVKLQECKSFKTQLNRLPVSLLCPSLLQLTHENKKIFHVRGLAKHFNIKQYIIHTDSRITEKMEFGHFTFLIPFSFWVHFNMNVCDTKESGKLKKHYLPNNFLDTSLVTPGALTHRL